MTLRTTAYRPHATHASCAARAALASACLALACAGGKNGAPGFPDGAGSAVDANVAIETGTRSAETGTRAADGLAGDRPGSEASGDGRPGDGGAAVDRPPGDGTAQGSALRGYFTTPEELAAVRDKAMRGVEPYRAAVAELMKFVGAPADWPHGTISGAVDCGGGAGFPEVPITISNTAGAALVLGKAYAFHLTRDEAFAADARARILDLTDTTGWGGELYSGGNQCILNLSWFMPRFIQAATLLETSAAWKAEDKQAFQSWLAREVYKKTSWASVARANNWGAAGSYTSAMIADYLSGGTIATLTERDGTARTLPNAWAFHQARQVARMNGTERMDAMCPQWGIQDHGGIPEELRRGTSGCAATALAAADASYTYQQAHIQSLVAHAEMLLRRGDASLYDARAADGRGSLRQAIAFVIRNPTRSWPWDPEHMSDMEVAYRHYRDADMCAALACGDAGRRVIASGAPRLSRVFSFGTLTHGFAPGEDPGPPPVVAAPGR